MYWRFIGGWKTFNDVLDGRLGLSRYPLANLRLYFQSLPRCSSRNCSRFKLLQRCPVTDEFPLHFTPLASLCFDSLTGCKTRKFFFLIPWQQHPVEPSPFNLFWPIAVDCQRWLVARLSLL